MHIELDAAEIPPHLKSYFEPVPGPKNKDALGIPWMVAFALRADGWWLRSAITWCKTNTMPESVRERCKSATEVVFMLAKSERYFYDGEAIKEPVAQQSLDRYQREKAKGMISDNGHKYDFKPTVGAGI